MGERVEIFTNYYMALYSDGTLGLADAGYVGTLELEEVKELYEALKKFFESHGG